MPVRMSNSSSSAKPTQTKNSQSHDDTFSGNHPAKDKAFPLWTVTEIRWNMWRFLKRSCVIFSIRDPWLHKKFASFSLIGPSVSTATGTKRYLGISFQYFSILRFAACSAAAPAILDVPLRCEAAWVSGEVASQRRHFPACHAIKVTPSGRLASVRYKPIGSLVDGMFALDKALQIMSFSRWRRSWRPAAGLLLHENTCVPKASTNEPQWQWWGSHRRLPIRKATAALMASFGLDGPWSK